MNRRTSIIGRALIAVLLLGLLVIGMATASAAPAGSGTLTVHIGENDPDLPKDQLVVSIYQIGVEDTDVPSRWRISELFSGVRILEATNSREIEQAADEVAQILHSRNSGSTRSGTLGANGSYRYENLQAGIYFGEVTAENLPGLETTNFIVTIPDLSGTYPSYNADVYVKYEYNPPEPPEEPEEPPEEPEEPVERGDHPYTITIYYYYVIRNPDGTITLKAVEVEKVPQSPYYADPRNPYFDELWAGDRYYVQSKDIPGWRVSRKLIEGIMPHRNLEFVVYYYPRDMEVFDDYETALGLGDIQMHVGVCYE